MPANGKQLISSLTKGLVIMELLMENGSMGVTELGKRLSVNKSSAYRLLCTLEERGFVEKSAENSKYRLGMKLAGFKLRALDDAELLRAAKPYLEKLAAVTGEAAALCVLLENEGILIDKCTGSQRIVANLNVGMPEPLNCTALGKVLLAAIPEAGQRRILASINLEPRTPKTIIDPEAVVSDMKKTLIAGAGVDDEEYGLGMRCVAAPVYSYDGTVTAAIGISGPVTRVTPERIGEYIEKTKSVANELSAKLGCNTKNI